MQTIDQIKGLSLIIEFLIQQQLNTAVNLIKDLKNPKLKETAFRELLDQYQERLYWHIRKIVITHEDTNDVLQNTFIRIFNGIKNFKEKSSLHTWMYRIAYNESIRFLTKNNRTNFLSLDDTINNNLELLAQDSYFDGDEIQTKLQTIIAQLTNKQRLIFQMKYFDDLSFKQIAEIIEINENTLKSSYYSAVKIIEEKMLS